MERLIKFTAGEIRRVIRRYGPWAAGKREAFSSGDIETARNFTAGDNTCITLYEEPDDDLYWLEIWPGFGASCYTVWVVGEELQSNATKPVARQTDSDT